MYHKLVVFFTRIRTKVTLVLFVIFALSVLLVNYIVDRQITSSEQEQIVRDLKNLKNNTQVYVKQTLILNKENNDEKGFKNVVYDVVKELYQTSKHHLQAYTLEGVFLSGTKENLFRYSPEKDFEYAKLGNSSYTLDYSTPNNLSVYFSVPVMVESKSVGIIRYYIDYSASYRQGNETKEMILAVTVLVFAGTFLIIWLLVTKTIHPIQKLTKSTSAITEAITDGTNTMEALPVFHATCKSYLDRYDEIGELTRNYDLLLETIRNQIAVLNEDKESIKDLLVSKQEFYNNVTHELKTPLTTINGYAQLIEANGTEDEELVKKGMEHIMHESERLHKMVLQLLEMSNRSLRMDKSLVNLKEVIKTVAESMQLKAARYHDTIVFSAERNYFVMAVEERIRQLYINLVDNAIKYGEPGTVIHITCKEEKDHIEVSIENEGAGIDPDKQRDIFEPFYRVNKEFSREQGSSGLGLSICQKIMEEHHGVISVKSTPGEKTIFTTTFCKTKDGREIR